MNSVIRFIEHIRHSLFSKGFIGKAIYRACHLKKYLRNLHLCCFNCNLSSNTDRMIYGSFLFRPSNTIKNEICYDPAEIIRKGKKFF